MKQIIIFSTVAVIVLIAVIFATITIKKRNRINRMMEIQDRVGTLKALPVQYLLNKVSLMPKSYDVEKEFNNWVDTYERLVGSDNRYIKEQINHIEDNIYSNKFGVSSKAIKELEIFVLMYEKNYEALLADLTLATQVDVRNREEITSQKEKYRNFKKMYQANIDVYKPYNTAIEKYFTEIEMAFTNIDILLNQSEVDKARNKAATLEGDLLKMKDILNTLPGLVIELSRTLPGIVKEVEDKYNYCIKQKYYITFLDIPMELTTIQKEILRTFTNNNNVFIKELSDLVTTLRKRLDSLVTNLHDEIKANEVLEKKVYEFIQSVDELNRINDKVLRELVEIKQNYVLTKNETLNISMQTRLCEDITFNKKAVIARYDGRRVSANNILQEINILQPKTTALIYAFRSYLRSMEDLVNDERRIEDEYANMSYLIKDCESLLNETRLPMLSKSYFKTISEAKEALNEIKELQNLKPLNLAVLNSELKVAQDIVYSLYDNSRNLVKTAKMAENAIVFGNRYRLKYPNVDAKLNRAETLFNSGEYTKSLTTAIEAVETLYPSVKSELVKFKTEDLKKLKQQKVQ